jgi:hypothetical protein
VTAAPRVVERVQTGVRIEKHVLKVLKAIAEYHDITLGDLLEGIVLHAFDGKAPFGPEGLARIREFRRIYGLDLDSRHSHRMIEPDAPSSRGRARRTGPRS